MKWISVNHPSASVHKYHLTEGNTNKVVLKYNLDQQSVRVSNADSQRLFFMEKIGGLWNNRIIVKNEYGVETGKLSFDRNFRAGIVEMEGKKYHYRVEDNDSPIVILYEHHLSMPAISCGFSLSSFADKDAATAYTCLLLGLCWHLSPIHAKHVEYARAV
jgi:hypothetical protein